MPPLPDDVRVPGRISEIRNHEGESGGWIFLAFTFICCGIWLSMQSGMRVAWVTILSYSLRRFNIHSQGCQVVMWNSCGNSDICFTVGTG